MFMTETKIQPTPYPGMPATYHAGSDRYAMTVVAVRRNGQELDVLFQSAVTEAVGTEPTPADLAEFVAYLRAQEAAASFGQAFRVFTRRLDGTYRAKGASGRGFVLSLGAAVDYRDPSF
jgi:hypothetical protein